MPRKLNPKGFIDYLNWGERFMFGAILLVIFYAVLDGIRAIARLNTPDGSMYEVKVNAVVFFVFVTFFIILWRVMKQQFRDFMTGRKK